MATIVGRMDQNSEIFKKILNDEDFNEVLRDYYLKRSTASCASRNELIR